MFSSKISMFGNGIFFKGAQHWRIGPYQASGCGLVDFLDKDVEEIKVTACCQEAGPNAERPSTRTLRLTVSLLWYQKKISLHQHKRCCLDTDLCPPPHPVPFPWFLLFLPSSFFFFVLDLPSSSCSVQSFVGTFPRAYLSLSIKNPSRNVKRIYGYALTLLHLLSDTVGVTGIHSTWKAQI